jgi:ribosomal protein L11 methyltransferase
VLWQQLEISFSAGDLAKVEALLTLAGAEAFSLHEASGTEILEPSPGTMPLWPEIELHALFPSVATATAASGAVNNAIRLDRPARIKPISDTAWRSAGAQQTPTQAIGKRLMLTSPQADVSEEGRVKVMLNRGLAFGTGDHPTTFLCLEWLEENFVAGKTFLDFGCGCGVLAIAALRLGASAAWAVDIDRQALQATRENALQNDVLENLWIGLPDELPSIETDVLIANILAQPLQELAAELADRISPGGNIVLSGILSKQSDAVKAAYESQFNSFTTRQRDGWVRLSADRI